MKKSMFFLVLFLLTISNVLATSNTFDTELEQFYSDFGATVLNTTVNQNVYADAFIGKLLPALPPHLAVGASATAAKFDLTHLESVTNALGIAIDDRIAIKIKDDIYLPVFSADARIGGIFLPFDIGATFMKISNFPYFGMKFDYMNWGADLRWALLEQKLVIPCISLGVGFYQSTGGVLASTSITQLPSSVGGALEDAASNFFGTGTETEHQADLKVNYKMNILAFNAQVSWKILIITPFIGGRYILHSAEYDYSISNSTNTVKNSREVKFRDDHIFHIFGGVAMNLPFVPTTVSVSYDLQNKIFNGAVSIRIQL